MIITSRTNPRISRIRRLHKRAEREQTGLFLAEGIRAVVEAVRQGAQVEDVVIAPGLLRSTVALEVAARLSQLGATCLEVSPEVFESLSVREGPQGLLAVIHQRWRRLAEARADAGLCWVALDEVQDPGNLGSILRTADAVGAAGVILLGSTADPYDPVAVRASTGAVFSQSLVRASLDELTAWREQHEVAMIGTSGASATGYRSVAYQPPLVLLMGSEQQGLSEVHKALCERIVSIPMVGHVDSLNLSVAAGIVLYEIFHQNRARLSNRQDLT